MEEAVQEGINTKRLSSLVALSREQVEKRPFNVWFNEVVKVTATGGEDPSSS